MLNPALAALLKTAQMATPQGTPTVAQGIAKLALQQEMPQAAPPALPEVAENVQAALPTMERNAQQAQMEQIANMVAQRMSPENSGIAQLPVGGGEYAEGGVVGYSGTGESLVKNLSIDEINRMSPEMRKAYFKDLMERRNAAGPTPVSGGAASVGSGSLGGAFRTGLTRFAPLAFVTDLFTTSDEDIALLKQAEAERGAANAVDTLKGRPRGQADYGVEELSPPQERGKEMRYPPRPFDVVATKPRPGPGASSTTTAAAAAPASAVGAPATGEDPYKGLKALAGRGEFAQPEPAMRDQIALLNEARLARGLTGGVGEGLEKLVQDLRAEQARLGTEREKSLKGRPLENLIQSFAAARTGGLGGLGRTYANLQSAQRAEQERFNALQYERKIALAKMDADKEAMREAAARGDKEGYDKALSDHRATARDFNKLTAEAQMNLAQFAGQDRRAAEDRASRERMEALQRESQERIARGNNATQKAIADARKEGKPPYDTIVDNVAKEFGEWTKSIQGVTAKQAERDAMYREILQRHVRLAKQMGLQVPDSLLQSAAPGAKLKYNPATGKIE